jgi:hypothetical protein
VQVGNSTFVRTQVSGVPAPFAQFVHQFQDVGDSKPDLSVLVRLGTANGFQLVQFSLNHWRLL